MNKFFNWENKFFSINKKIIMAIKKDNKWEEPVEIAPSKIKNNPGLKKIIFLLSEEFKNGINSPKLA